MKSFRPLILAAFALLLTACAKKDDSVAKAESSGHHHHVHKAPHGGSLVELGEHQFNLEFVHDRAAGTLTAYALDAHAENFVRLPLPVLPVTVKVGSATHALALAATANAMTGETVGDTSQFTGAADWLRGVEEFSGVVPEVTLRGIKFTNVAFAIGDDHDHDHDHGKGDAHKHD